MKKTVLALVVLLCALYGAAYAYAYNKAPKPHVEYYGNGETVEYKGVEYTIKGMLYTEEEMMEEFGLSKEQLREGRPYNYKFIVADLKMKRVKNMEDDDGIQMHGTIISRYWQVGMEPNIGQLIQKDGYKDASELDIGEETSGYQVFSINDANHCERIWNNADKETVYYELPDYEGSEYLRWIRIMN